VSRHVHVVVLACTAEIGVGVSIARALANVCAQHPPVRPSCFGDGWAKTSWHDLEQVVR